MITSGLHVSRRTTCIGHYSYCMFSESQYYRTVCCTLINQLVVHEHYLRPAELPQPHHQFRLQMPYINYLVYNIQEPRRVLWQSKINVLNRYILQCFPHIFGIFLKLSSYESYNFQNYLMFTLQWLQTVFELGMVQDGKRVIVTPTIYLALDGVFYFKIVKQ